MATAPSDLLNIEGPAHAEHFITRKKKKNSNGNTGAFVIACSFTRSRLCIIRFQISCVALCCWLCCSSNAHAVESLGGFINHW